MRYWAVQAHDENKGWYTAHYEDSLAVFPEKQIAQRWLKEWKWAIEEVPAEIDGFRIIELVEKSKER